MESITIICQACKSRILIENKTGVHLCSICECKNEHYVFPNDFTNEEITYANKLFKDFKKSLKKHDIERNNNDIMDIVVYIIKSK